MNPKYIAGLLITYVAWNLMGGHGVPALLYIDPFTLGNFSSQEARKTLSDVKWIFIGGSKIFHRCRNFEKEGRYEGSVDERGTREGLPSRPTPTRQGNKSRREPRHLVVIVPYAV